jgi:hypothetical protein
VEWGSSGLILKEGKLEEITSGNGRFENSSGKSGRWHLGEEVTEEQKFRSVEDGKLRTEHMKCNRNFQGTQ